MRVDVIDCARERYIALDRRVAGVAGVLVDEARDLAFTSNRGEDTVGLFRPGPGRQSRQVGVGRLPNGLAFDPRRGTLLAANVGDPAVPGSFTPLRGGRRCHAAARRDPRPGPHALGALRPRGSHRFFVNIAAPAQIIVVAAAADPTRIAGTYEIPAAGPHGLELDPSTAGGSSARVTRASWWPLTPRPVGPRDVALSGAPDVIFSTRPSVACTSPWEIRA